jgi:uncharacterized protein YecE (DUF72 family)
VSELRIGISGWRYEPWRGVFYPEGLPQRSELAYAARHFNSVEINGSFHSLQKPAFCQRWYEETPAGFVFAVKGGRFITHMKKLRAFAARHTRREQARARACAMARGPGRNGGEQAQAVAPSRRGALVELRRPFVHRPAARARHRVRGGRHGRQVADARRSTRPRWPRRCR